MFDIDSPKKVTNAQELWITLFIGIRQVLEIGAVLKSG